MTSVGKAALIIDDSRILTRELQQILKGLHLEAQSCSKPKDLSDDELKKFNMIFVELLQFEHNGFQLVREITSQVTCPVLLISGSGRTSDKQWAEQAGAAGLLRRPLGIENVASCLDKLALVAE